RGDRAVVRRPAARGRGREHERQRQGDAPRASVHPCSIHGAQSSGHQQTSRWGRPRACGDVIASVLVVPSGLAAEPPARGEEPPRGALEPPRAVVEPPARGGGASTRWPFAAVADGSRLNHSRRWAITSRANRAPARWFKVEPSSPAGNNGSEPLAAPANGSRLNHPPLARKDRPAEARAPPAPTPRALRTPHRRRAPPSTHDGVRHPRAHGLAV